MTLRPDGYASPVKWPTTPGWWVAAVASAAAVVAALATGALRGVELPVRDALQRTLGKRVSSQVAAVLIDEAALATEGPWPWPRAKLAALVRAARDAGAAGVVIDVLLLDDRPDDAQLAAALESVPTVLVATIDGASGRWLAPRGTLRNAAALAHGVFELDHDGVLRRLATTKQAEGRALPALAIAAARLAAPALPIPVGRTLVPGLRTAPAAVETTGAAEVLRGRGASHLRGRVAFVGLSAAGLGDRVVTPVSTGSAPDPGVLVQTAVTDSILSGDLLRPVSPVTAGLPSLLLVLAVGAATRLGGPRRLLGEAVVVAAPPLLALAGIHLAGILLPTVTLTALALLTVTVAEARAALVAWRRAGTTTALLGAAAGEAPVGAHGSLDKRLDLVERLAVEAARRRVASEESARVMAHELKTPLTSVKGLAQMLRDLDLPEAERRRAAHLLVGEAGRLQNLVEHLTELERLPLRPFEDTAGDVDLSSLVRLRAETVAGGHARTVRHDVAPGLHVRGDARLLERVLDNLLANAFKFSPADSVVEVRAYGRSGEVVVEVRDHGCGIAPAEQEEVFRRFARGSSAQGREGMGLGLALVREVVTWHGGHVSLKSAPGQGSTFIVTLPAVREGSRSGQDPCR